MRIGRLRAAALGALLSGVVAGPGEAAEPLAVQDSNVEGVVAEITECRRKGGVLTVQMRLRNGSGSDQSFYVVNNRNYDAFYVVADNKKYFVLRDSEKTPLAPAADAGGGVRISLKKGASWTWWARYPAPPAEVKAVDYYTPLTPPFDGLPVSDAP